MEAQNLDPRLSGFHDQGSGELADGQGAHHADARPHPLGSPGGLLQGLARERDLVKAILWFGYDVTAAWVVGTERLLRALYQQARSGAWKCSIMTSTSTWPCSTWSGRRIHVDEVMWPDDMGFKGKQFFGLETYRALLKPIHQRAIEWATPKGIRRTCTRRRRQPFIPDLIEIGWTRSIRLRSRRA